jgi:hypothetical protein
VVVDGLWECSKLKDFVLSITRVRGVVRAEGPLESPESVEEVDPFIDQVRARMVAMLAEIREERDAG